MDSRFCRHLRSKHYYFLDAVPTSADQLEDASHSFWCTTTMQCIGPDRERVSPQGCAAGRACYRSSFEEVT